MDDSEEADDDDDLVGTTGTTPTVAPASTMFGSNVYLPRQRWGSTVDPYSRTNLQEEDDDPDDNLTLSEVLRLSQCSGCFCLFTLFDVCVWGALD